MTGAARMPGMDNEYYDFSAMASPPAVALAGRRTRRPLRHRQPGALRMGPLQDQDRPQSMPGFRAPLPYPDMRNFSQREYANRVGIFRVMDVLDRYGIPATVAMDAAVASNYPFLVEQCRKRGWEFIGHGLTATRLITSEMTEEEERDYIRGSLAALQDAAGSRPAGWMGPAYSESTRTPRLLAEEGLRYLCDWPNDDQPYRMKVPGGEMYSLPVLLDLDDFHLLWTRILPIMDYSRVLQDSFDRLYVEGERSGRLMVLNLHPWLIGQPFRSKYLDQALSYIAGHQRVWKATGSEIIDWYASNTS